MDNSFNLNNGSSNSMYPPSSTSSSFLDSSSPTLTSNSFFDTIKSISIFTWVIIFFILAFLGFNIFVYLAKGTQDITNFFSPIIKYFTGLFGGVTSQVIDVSAEGAKGVVNTTANLTTSGLNAVQQTTPGGTTSGSLKTTPVQIPQADIMQTNTLNKALNTNTVETQKSSTDYEADESSSTIQNGAAKSGWCYIGEDRGFRSCAKVGVDDKCMSGEIFPSNEICINPNLRT